MALSPQLRDRQMKLRMEQRTPTSTNPVIKTPSPITDIANPREAETAIRSSELTLPKTSIPTGLPTKMPITAPTEMPANTGVTPVTTRAGQDTGFVDRMDDQGTAGRLDVTPTERTTELKPQISAQEKALQDAERRRFVSGFTEAGLTADDLMRITGMQDYDSAINLLRNKGSLSMEDQLALNERLEQAKFDYADEQRKSDLLTEEEQIRADLEKQYAPRYASAKEAGETARETALRVQGRAAMGSKSEEQQQGIIEKQRQIEESIAAEQRLEERMQIAAARGASQGEMETLGKALQNAKDQRLAYQQEIELQQAGLDEAAIERAEFNTKTMLDALKAGFEYDPDTDSFTSAEGMQAIDQNVSKMLGYASDEFGNPVVGADGNPLQIDKDNDIEWDSFEDRFGNTVFFDKSNPTNTFKPGGTRTFTNPSGQTSSSPTSDISGVQNLGIGDEYQRDNGSTGNLGENCVKFARENVPNLPFGLFNKQDKIDAINSAVEQGFGTRGGSQAQVGDAILTGEGGVGHAAVVVGVDEQTGELILAEANYAPGQVTQGRRIAMDDPLINGSISSTGQPQMSSVINEQATNEGVNPAIATQVVVEQTQPEVKFDRMQIMEFNKFAEDGEIPLSVGSDAEYNQFMNEYATYQNSPQANFLQGKDRLDATTDIRKEFNSLAKDPKKAITQINLLRTAYDKALDDVAQGKSINAASQGVLIPFQKMLDPTSVVRESEYARSGDGQALIARMEGQLQKIRKGGAGVTADGLREFAETAELFMGNYQNALIDDSAPLMQQAKEYGLDTEQIFSPEVIKLIEGGRIEKDATPTTQVNVKNLAAEQGFDYAGAIAAGATEEEIQEFLTQ